MAVATRNFVNVSLRSDAVGANLTMTRTYNRLYVLNRTSGSRSALPLAALTPRQAGYMPYSPTMLIQYARAAANAHVGLAVVGDLWSSVNARPIQRFVRDDVDLSAVDVPRWRRPAWVLPVIRDFGNVTWRRRMRALGAALRSSGHVVAFFADVPDGAPFTESYPSIDAFPARALVLPLSGRLRVTTPSGAAEPEPPSWGVDASGTPAIEPRAPPVRVPFGAPHSVATLGPGPALWAYVFGVDRELERELMRPSKWSKSSGTNTRPVALPTAE